MKFQSEGILISRLLLQKQHHSKPAGTKEVFDVFTDKAFFGFVLFYFNYNLVYFSCTCISKPLCLRVPVHVHQELAASLMESSGWKLAESAGRGKVQPRAGLHFSTSALNRCSSAARQPPY